MIANGLFYYIIFIYYYIIIIIITLKRWACFSEECASKFTQDSRIRMHVCTPWIESEKRIGAYESFYEQEGMQN